MFHLCHEAPTITIKLRSFLFRPSDQSFVPANEPFLNPPQLPAVNA
jgi:hypothetical protein